MYHIAVAIYVSEILLGLLHWTETVTDALAVCPAADPNTASEVPQWSSVPATTIGMSTVRCAMSPPREQPAEGRSSIPGTQQCTESCSTQQGVSPKAVAPSGWKTGYTEKAPGRGKVWERKGAAGFALQIRAGHRPSLPWEGSAEHGPKSCKEGTKSRDSKMLPKAQNTIEDIF